MSKILWVDDNESVTAMVSEVLESHGHRVRVLADPRLLKDLDTRGFDLIILDLYLEILDKKTRRGRVESGLMYLDELLGHDAALRARTASGETRILVLSQHLADYDLRAALRDFSTRRSLRASVRSKSQNSGKGKSRSEDVANVIQDVLNLKEDRNIDDEVRQQFDGSEDLDYFSVPLAAFRALPDYQQAELQERAYTALESGANRYFRDNPEMDWQIFAGSTKAIRSGSGELPTVSERSAVSESVGHPVLVYLRPNSTDSSVEEETVLSRVFRRRRPLELPEGCGGSMANYPTVSLLWGDDLRHYHFDTGADISYMRASHLREFGALLMTENRSRQEGRRGTYYFIYELPEEGIASTIVDQRKSGHINVRVSGLAVEQFKNWPNARRCGDFDCEWRGLDQLCGIRSGLIGRNFIFDNELVIEVDSSEATTYVRKSK